jgi:hypothetical protein
LAFVFMMFGSHLHVVVLLFNCSYISDRRFFVLLLSSSCSSFVLFALLLFVCCYLLKNLVLPPCIPPCRNWEWLGVKN